MGQYSLNDSHFIELLYNNSLVYLCRKFRSIVLWLLFHLSVVKAESFSNFQIFFLPICRRFYYHIQWSFWNQINFQRYNSRNICDSNILIFRSFFFLKKESLSINTFSFFSRTRLAFSKKCKMKLPSILSVSLVCFGYLTTHGDP